MQTQHLNKGWLVKKQGTITFSKSDKPTNVDLMSDTTTTIKRQHQPFLGFKDDKCFCTLTLNNDIITTQTKFRKNHWYDWFKKSTTHTNEEIQNYLLVETNKEFYDQLQKIIDEVKLDRSKIEVDEQKFTIQFNTIDEETVEVLKKIREITFDFEKEMRTALREWFNKITKPVLDPIVANAFPEAAAKRRNCLTSLNNAGLWTPPRQRKDSQNASSKDEQRPEHENKLLT